MKRFILLILCSLPLVASAQNNESFSKLISRYSTIEGITTIELSKEMLRSMGVSGDIDLLQAIRVEDSSQLASLQADVDNVVSSAEYKLMLSVNQGDNRVRIYTITTRSGISDLMIYTVKAPSAIIVRFQGENLQLNEANSLANLNL